MKEKKPGEIKLSEQQERALWHIRAMLHYHERMTLGIRDEDEFAPFRMAVCDPWADALQEAMRCMMQVYGFPEGTEERFVL